MAQTTWGDPVNSKIIGVAAAATVVFGGVAALAHDVSPTVKPRADFFHEVGKNMKALRGELGKPDASVAEVQKYAKAIDALAPKVTTLFPANSAPGPGVVTEAKAEAWTKPAELAKAQDAFVKAAHGLNAAAAKGDVAGIKVAAQGLADTCKGCHEKFREEKH